jgi:hypothetical protein
MNTWKISPQKISIKNYYETHEAEALCIQFSQVDHNRVDIECLFGLDQLSFMRELFLKVVEPGKFEAIRGYKIELKIPFITYYSGFLKEICDISGWKTRFSDPKTLYYSDIPINGQSIPCEFLLVRFIFDYFEEKLKRG